MRLKVCICVLVWVCLGKFYNISSQRYLVYVYMWACVCVPGSVCAWEHAIAGHSEHSHIQAIIISPPAIITTSDSPLLTKLISPSFPSAHPPCSNLSPSPPWPTHFSGICAHPLPFFFVLPFPLCLTTQGKASFLRRFIHLYLLRGCYALLRCVYIEYLTSAGHTPHPQRQTEKGKKEKKKKQKLREKMERRLQLFGNQLVVFTLQKPICTSFPF